MLQVDINDKGDGQGVAIRVSGDGTVLPVRHANIQLAVNCLPTADVHLVAAALDIRSVHSELYVFLGDRTFRLVDETKYDVIEKA